MTTCLGKVKLGKDAREHLYGLRRVNATFGVSAQLDFEGDFGSLDAGRIGTGVVIRLAGRMGTVVVGTDVPSIVVSTRGGDIQKTVVHSEW